MDANAIPIPGSVVAQIRANTLAIEKRVLKYEAEISAARDDIEVQRHKIEAQRQEIDGQRQVIEAQQEELERLRAEASNFEEAGKGLAQFSKEVNEAVEGQLQMLSTLDTPQRSDSFTSIASTVEPGTAALSTAVKATHERAAAAQQAAAQRVAAERARGKAASDKVADEKAAAETKAAERAAAQKAAAQRVAVERARIEKAATDEAVARKAAAEEERAAAKKAAERATEQAAAMQAAAMREAAEEVAAEQAAADQAEAMREAAEQVAAEQVAAEKAAAGTRGAASVTVMPSVELKPPGNLQTFRSSRCSIEEWLEELKPSFSSFSPTFKAAGVDTLDDLWQCDKDDVSSIVDSLVESGAKSVHVKRVQREMEKFIRESACLDTSPSALLRGRTDVDSGGSGGVMDTTDGPRQAKRLLSKQPTQPLPLEGHSASLATELGVSTHAVLKRSLTQDIDLTGVRQGDPMQAQDIDLTGVRQGDPMQAKLPLRPQTTQSLPLEAEEVEPAADSKPEHRPLDATPSVREWLDEVKSGYGCKFAMAFEAFGIEDQSDLTNIDDNLHDLIFEKLRAECGAKELHTTVLNREVLLLSGRNGNSSAAPSFNRRRSSLVGLGSDGPGGSQRWVASGKRFAAFVSHHKREAAMEARFLKEKLEGALDAECFLDSDALSDLRNLLDHVRESDVLLLVQTAEVLLRPWCILEIHTAVAEGIPIVAVALRGKQYDFADAMATMTFLDVELERRNPGASKTLSQHNVSPIDAAYMLSNVIPNLISVPFDSASSSNMIEASINDIIQQMRGAHAVGGAVKMNVTRAEWLSQRSAMMPPSNTVHHSAEPHEALARPLALLPAEVPALPKGYVGRDALISDIKAKIIREHPRGFVCVTAQGMGGAGKSVIAAALCNDAEVREFFDTVCFAGAGQTPDMRSLQASLYRQLTGKALSADINEEAAVLAALQQAAARQRVLLVIDDAWELAHYQQLACLSAATQSAIVVTTRIKDLVPGAAAFSLGVLDPDTAIALLLETAGALAVKPYDPKLHQAVEACGRLPLTLAVAGSMLESFGGKCTDEFLRILTEDRGEALREGEYGDENVRIEDRIITATLQNYSGGESARVRDLFFAMAMLPEDVPAPASLFDLLAVSVFGASGKRPQLQVRSWLTALIRLSLVIGSLADGVFMHDIVRDYAISRCPDLRSHHRQVLNAILDGAPADGWPAPWEAGQYGRDSTLRYVGIHLKWHISNAVDTSEDFDELLDRVAAHSVGFMFAVSSALGEDEVLRRMDELENDDRYLYAARLAVGLAYVAKHGDDKIAAGNMEMELKLLWKACELLIKVDGEAEANLLEIKLVNRAQTLIGYNVGGFSPEVQGEILNARFEVLIERRRQLEGHTFEFLFEETSNEFAAMVGDWIGTLTKCTSVKEAVDAHVIAWKMLVRNLELLQRAKTSVQRDYTILKIAGYTSHLCAGSERVRFEGLRNAGFSSTRAICEAMGGRAVILQAMANRDHFAMQKQGKDDIHDFADVGLWVPVALEYGELAALSDWFEYRALEQQKMNSMVQSGESADAYHLEQIYLWLMGARTSSRQGLLDFGARVAVDVLSVRKWSDVEAFFTEIWAFMQNVFSHPRLGTKKYVWTTVALDFVPLLWAGSIEDDSGLGKPRANDDPSKGFDSEIAVNETVTELLERVADPDTMIEEDRVNFLNRTWATFTITEMACVLSEQQDLDTHAEKYADYLLGGETDHASVLMTANFVLGKIFRKRNDVDRMREHFNVAFRTALRNGRPVMALCVGREMGGDKGQSMMEEAAAATGRPLTELLSEYEVAASIVAGTPD